MSRSAPGKSDAGHGLLQGGDSPGIPGLIVFARHSLAQTFLIESGVNQRPCPGKIVSLGGFPLGDPFIYQISRGFLDRGEFAALHIAAKHVVLFLGQGDVDRAPPRGVGAVS